MDIANMFADGEDTYNNKRIRSPEDDRSHHYKNQKCRSRNYDGYSGHNKVATSSGTTTTTTTTIKVTSVIVAVTASTIGMSQSPVDHIGQGHQGITINQPKIS
jgi:hypothetical protein